MKITGLTSWYVTPRGVSITDSWGEISHNEFAASFAIDISSAPAPVKIEHNSVRGSTGGGIYVQYANGSLIADNLVEGTYNVGIFVYHSDGVWIVRNSVRQSAAYGVRLDYAERCQLENNVLIDNGWYLGQYGLMLSPQARDIVYRGNTARGSSGSDCAGVASGGDFCDEGTNNTSHGDNYMPNQM